MNARIAILFAVVGVLVLACLVWAQVWLARRFKRRVQRRPGGRQRSSALVTLIVGLVALGWTAAHGRRHPRTARSPTSRDAATARIEGNNAKSNESLTLIARGCGGSFEEAWQASASDGRASRISRLRPTCDVVWQPYADVHTQIRELDDGGRWDQAVRWPRARPSPNTTFTAFDDATSPSVVDSVTAETSRRSGRRRPVD